MVRSRLKEIILAAPDIDADVFMEQIAPALIAHRRPITLYASSNDVALKLSKKANGYPRAGDSGEGLVVMPGIETIDASEVDSGFLGHSYFADVQSVISDLFQIIWAGKRADRRLGLRRVESIKGRYWAITD